MADQAERAAVEYVEATQRVSHGRLQRRDAVAIEEPLELRLVTGRTPITLAMLMRTPGHDRELLTGWLLAEGLLPQEYALAADTENDNIWHLHTPDQERVAAGARLGVSSSACGVCGTGSIERLAVRCAPPTWRATALSPRLLTRLPEALQRQQVGFQQSGGLHGAALFTTEGELLRAFEDVGRHNAVDKVVGWAHLTGLSTLNLILVVSSRAGFEIVQKAVQAGVAVVVTVGAASTLAIETAQAFGVTLCAFVREGRLTVYSGEQRLQAEW